jgi:site-specific DNA-methyltransferase (adenine-specific)
MHNNPLPRLDDSAEIRETLLPQCRLALGGVWEDSQGGHRVGCLDAANAEHIESLYKDRRADLCIHDPPYNLVAFEQRSIDAFIDWCRRWMKLSVDKLADDANAYVWLGADQTDGFQPLPEFMIMMRELPLQSRSFITVRNQRGYGTQKNWMAVRQELLYYTKGSPFFEPVYTDIPKVLKGYYKSIGGKTTDNLQRSRSGCIRPGNVWLDIQQVFYRLEENVSGCYAQKPLKAIERIVQSSSREGDVVADHFAHAGTTLLAAERLNRRCVTMDIDPVFCEITIRRIEHFRKTGRTGWQNGHPFEDDAGVVLKRA